ncbi:TPA_asm: P1-P2 fusion protein [Cardamom polerovirus]|uniref:P1-P2 fusion protein n=1 Tax=Cardamom polerovirus TaxID=2754871 RepID=A0AAD2KQ73_9VIRU|nr:TPA_asm: P1-P2 fusion protein [Cardamom polerovirus]
MGIITLLSVLSALFCLFFHFFYAHTLPSINLGTLNYHNRTPWLLPNGARPWDLPPDTGFQTSQCSPCPSCPTPNPTEFSYKDLCQGVWQKLLMDLTLDHTGLSVGSNNMWGRIREIFGNLTSATIAKMLWLSVTVWSGVLWVLASAVWGMFSSYTAPTLLLLLLYFLTKSLCQVVRWIFGSSLLRIMSTPMRITFRVLKSKTSFHNEKRVIGHESFEIPQDPPKSSVLQLISICSGKEEHVGYANCVRLYNNENALITCAHVGEDVLVKGKTGNAIQIGKFCPLYYSRDTDLVILTGPPNWEGVLGCKGVHFVTSDKIAPSPVNIYFKKGVIPKFSEDKIDESTNPQWMTSFGKLTGVYKGFVQVLSNTEAGFSGSGYFSGKTLVGIHKGHVGTEFNFNLMVPIPPIRGITSPSYVYETTNIKGRVFADDVISRIADDAEKIYRLIEANKLIKFQSATGVNWADYVDESSRSPPHPAEVPLPSLMVRENPTPTQRGNGLRSPVCETTEARSPSLMASENPIPLMGNRVARLRPRNNRRLAHPFVRARRYKTLSATISKCRSMLREFVSGDYTDSSLTDPSGDRLSDSEVNGCADESGVWGERDDVGNYQMSCRQNFDESNLEEIKAKARQAWREEQAANFRAFFTRQYAWDSVQAEAAPNGFRHCGRTPAFYHPKSKTETEWGRRLCLKHPELGEKIKGFGWPLAGPKAEMRSLRLQADRWILRSRLAIVPSATERERIIAQTVKRYGNCKSTVPQCARGDTLCWKGFLNDITEAVMSLQMDAGVGVPLISYGIPTHRGWIDDATLLPVLTQLTFDRLQKMSKASFGEMTPEQLVQEGLCDPIRLFVKGEPHKQSKLDEGRYRLIMSVSLIDQLVARVLFQSQNKMEIALWRAIPSKPGFGLSTDEQTRQFVENLSEEVGVPPAELVNNWRNLVIPTDCSGFDWSVAHWMLQDDMEVRNRLTIANTELTKRLRSCWLKCIANSVLCLSDGTLLAQTTPGVQKSGSYNTSSTNSRIRVMAAYHCGADWAMAMGDDALESPNSNLNFYSDLGFKVEVSEKLEFCSHIFETPELAIPVNVNKMLYKLIHGYNPECGNFEVIRNYISAMVSVLQELRHDPDLVAKLHQWLAPTKPQNKE